VGRNCPGVVRPIETLRIRIPWTKRAFNAEVESSPGYDEGATQEYREEWHDATEGYDQGWEEQGWEGYEGEDYDKGDYDTSLQAHFTDSRNAPEVDTNPPPPIVHTYHATTNKSQPSNPNKSEGWSTDANYYDNY
jgi:hypothetical protein